MEVSSCSVRVEKSTKIALSEGRVSSWISS